MPDQIAPRLKQTVLLRAFDYGSAVCFGAAGALLSWLVVPTSFPFASEMALGMVLGVAGVLPLLAVFSWLLGGFEVIVLSMQVGMFAGMVGAMTTSTAVLDVAAEGAMVGLLIQILLHAADRSLGGEVSP